MSTLLTMNFQTYVKANNFLKCMKTFHRRLSCRYDAIIIGGGHNGLVAAAYLAKAGRRVCVMERRHLVGGAAVTEEIIPGFKFSRFSYVLSLLRPQICEELDLPHHGLRVFSRDPSSYTPLRNATSGLSSLTLGSDLSMNQKQIARFSRSDAENYPRFSQWLDGLATPLWPLLDAIPLQTKCLSFRGLMKQRLSLNALLHSAWKMGGDVTDFVDLVTAPAMKTLQKWFESEPLLATFATDSVIGAMTSPYHNGSGYVLLHHVMGECEGKQGSWGFPMGGMGSVSEAIAKSARKAGAEIFTEMEVKRILLSSDNSRVIGVLLADGREVHADVVLSNATCHHTYLQLMDPNVLDSQFVKEVKAIDYSSPVTKINVALSRLPNFSADPNSLRRPSEPQPHHRTTIHLNSEDTSLIHNAYLDAQEGIWSKRPLIEMTLPSALDGSLSPPGAHVAQLFTQYTPYHLKGGWTPAAKEAYADLVFDIIEEYAPGFKASAIGMEVLAPPDIERITGLTGGNIFQGAMSLDALYFGRLGSKPSQINGLYLCGSAAHPGGGVMGSAGKLAAQAVLKDARSFIN